MSDGYPARAPYFAMKFIRLMTKACVAQTLGHRVFTLLTVIAGTEDDRRYRGPVSFYNSQLLAVCGFGKWQTLDVARREAVAARWIHYQAPPTGKTRPGIYWVTLTHELTDVSDYSVDEVPAELGRKPPPSDRVDVSSQPYAAEGHSFGGPYPANGYGEGYGEGELPNLYLKPNTSCAVAHEGRVSLKGNESGKSNGKVSKRQRRQSLSYEPIDAEIATKIWRDLKAMNPDLPELRVKLNSWANHIRLLRETDGHDPKRILEVWAWAHADQFWRGNICSPDKLRKQFDALTSKMAAGRRSVESSKAVIAPPETPFGETGK